MEKYRAQWIEEERARTVRRQKAADEVNQLSFLSGPSVSALPPIHEIVEHDDRIARYSHRSIYARERRPQSPLEDTRERNALLRVSGDWIPGKMAEQCLGQPGFQSGMGLRIELPRSELMRDLEEGRLVKSRRSPRVHNGPLYHVVLLDHTMTKVISTERAIARGIFVKHNRKLNRLSIESFTLVQADLAKPVRIYLPIFPVNQDRCESIVEGRAYVHEIIRHAICDVQPNVVPPKYLMLNCEGKRMHHSLRGSDLLPIPNGCRVLMHPDRKLARIFPIDMDLVDDNISPEGGELNEEDEEELLVEFPVRSDGGIKV